MNDLRGSMQIAVRAGSRGLAFAVIFVFSASPGGASEPAVERLDGLEGEAAHLPEELAGGALEPLSNEQMSEISGQALLMAEAFESDDFLPQGEQGFSFKRLALDVDFTMNLNIDHLQLGCGGVNAQLAGAGETCDLDIEYLGFMGAGAGQPGAVAAGAPVEDQFLMEIPYLELAVDGDDDPTAREVVGLKLGARRTRGWLTMGHFLENEVIDGTPCSEDPDRIECHRGINRISGWLDNTLEGEVFGCIDLPGGSNCWIPGSEQGGPDPGPLEEQLRIATFEDRREIYGTRMARLFLENVVSLPENVPGGLDLPPLDVNINQALRFIHGVEIDADEHSAADFFISFQREPVIWPNFDRNIQPDDDGRYRAANTGWWMSMPDARLEGLETYHKIIDLDFIANPAFQDIDIGQRPADNCYGGLTFC